MRALFLFLCVSPSAALAACPSTEVSVFSCLADTNKEIRICQGAQAITYRYGSPGKRAELTLSAANESFEWVHGESPSAGILDYMTFNSGSTRYLIEHQSVYNDPSDASAHLTVVQGETRRTIECVSQLRFSPKGIKAQPNDLGEATPEL
jgi:hypothetical protein